MQDRPVTRLVSYGVVELKITHRRGGGGAVALMLCPSWMAGQSRYPTRGDAPCWRGALGERQYLRIFSMLKTSRRSWPARSQNKQSSNPGQGLGTNIVYDIIASHPSRCAHLSIWAR